MFGNWGILPENSSECERVLMQLKKQPAHILCLAEAEEIVETALRSAAHEDASKDNDTSSAVADELATRKSFEYLDERSSILMVVRANVARSLECLRWERRLEGVDTRRICYSRCMVGRVVLDKSVGHFGKEICTMAVQMHNKLANSIWPDKLTEFLGMVS